MECPHCRKAATFEAVEKFSFRPVIENWQADNPIQQMTQVECLCLSCDKRVLVDVRNKFIKPLDSTPIVDDVVRQIMDRTRDLKKSRTNPDVPKSVIEILRKRRFIIPDVLDSQELFSNLLEQM